MRSYCHPAEEQPLTPRELQILVLVARGRQNRAIAGELGISPNTVRNHLTHVYRHVGAHTRQEAVATALRQAGSAA